MKVNLLTFLICLILLGSQLKAQVIGGTYEKLAKLYNEGKYENCLYKADGYTYREENSKDAEPYLYIAMSLYQISLSTDEEIQEDYPDAIKQAIKYTGRFASKDKEDALYTVNIEFVNKMKQAQKDEIKEEFNNAKYSKAIIAAKAYDNMNREEDQQVALFIALNELLSDNSQGQNHYNDASTKIKADLKANKFKEDKILKSLLVDAFMKYTEVLVKKNKTEDAKKVIAFAKEIYPSDGYIKVQYNLLYN